MRLDKTYVRLFRVGRFTCEMSLNQNGLRSEWSPSSPLSLTPAEWAQYRAGRDLLMAEIQTDTGGNILVVEVE